MVNVDIRLKTSILFAARIVEPSRSEGVRPLLDNPDAKRLIEEVYLVCIMSHM